MRDNEFTRILDWPGYRVFRHEIDETAKTLRLWVRRKRGHRKLICSGCGRKFSDAHDYYQREVRDLPWRKYRTTVIIELYRVCCPKCGVRVEKVPQLPSKAPFSKDFEDAVGLACESASIRQVARQFRLAASTVRAIDLRYLKRWSAARRKDPLLQMGVDEIYFGKQMKFITVVSNLESGEPLWFGQDRKQETLDEFFRTQLKESQRERIEAACVDMWRPFTNSIEQWARNWRIVFDKFHVLQHANKAIDEVRRAEFFRKGANRTKVRFGVVEAINGNIKTLLRRGRGYKNLGYLLLKAQRMAATKTEFIVLQKRPKMRVSTNSCAEPKKLAYRNRFVDCRRYQQYSSGLGRAVETTNIGEVAFCTY